MSGARKHYIQRMDIGRMERIVQGALLDAINAHGPITGRGTIESAAKRVVRLLLGVIREDIKREKAERARQAASTSEPSSGSLRKAGQR